MLLAFSPGEPATTTVRTEVGSSAWVKCVRKIYPSRPTCRSSKQSVPNNRQLIGKVLPDAQYDEPRSPIAWEEKNTP